MEFPYSSRFEQGYYLRDMLFDYSVFPINDEGTAVIRQITLSRQDS